MAFLGSEKLKDLILKKKVIIPGDGKVECGAYELSLGEEVFCTDSKDKKKEFLSKPKEQVKINPGQFALLLTHETVDIPIDKIAFISIKAKIKLKGLVNVSGFHVDPGFKGKLLFSVYNAGTSPISLLKEEPCFLIWFADLELTKEEHTSYATGNHTHKNQTTILPEYIDHLSSGELASPVVLSKRIDEFRTELDKRIGLVEKEATAKDYLVKTAVGLGVIILIKLIFDWVAYDNGFKKGIELKQKELKLDSLINVRLKEEEIIRKRLDSLDEVQKAKEINLKRTTDSIQKVRSGK